MLKMLCSRYREDNINYIYSQVKELVEGGSPVLIIVPETHSHRAERMLLEKCGNSSGRWARVTTFTRLADRILEKVGSKELPIDKGGRVLTMYKAVKSVESSLEYYREAALRPDVLSGLVSVASELRSCLVEPERLMGEIDGFDAKLRDIAVIYTAYMAELGGRPAHGADRIEKALGHVAEFGAVEGANVFVYGFAGFTAAEYRMLGEIAEGGKNLCVALSMGEDESLFSEQIKTKGRLKRLSEGLGETWRFESPTHQTDDRPLELAELPDAMFDFEKAASNKDSKAIKIYSCKDPVQECELVAGMCRRLILEENIRLRDITVLSCSAEKYESYLLQSFARYNMPVYISRREDFLDKPAAMAALGAYRAIEDGMSLDAVLKYIKSDLVGLTRDQQEKLENYAYTWQIKGNRWFSDWTMAPDGYDTEDKSGALEEINAIRARLMAPLERLKNSLEAYDSGKNYIAALRAFIADIGLETQIEERAQALEARGRRQESAEYLQIYDIMTEALDQFGAVMGDSRLERGEFLSLLELMLGQYTIGTIPVSLDSVEISDFQRAPLGNVEYLFVIGCREGAMPPIVTGGSILRERDRIALETCGIELTQSDEERTYEYMSHIFFALQTPVKEVYFTYSNRDFDGEEASMSYLLKRMEEVFPSSRATPCGDVISKNALLASAPAFELLCSERDGDERASAVGFYEHKPEGLRARSLKAFASSGRGAVTSMDNIKRLYGSPIYMSATRAEKINSCRFAYFIEYGLRAKERQMAELKATNVGTLVHYVVENAVKELAFAEKSEIKDAADGHIEPADEKYDIRSAVNGYVETFLSERLGGREDKTARFLASIEALKGNIADIVTDVLEEIERSDFKPIAFEMSFGNKEGDHAPYRVEQGDIALDVSGQIDRVDGYLKDDTLFLKVSDYKTGTKTFGIGDIPNGMNLQMFIYMLMLQNTPVSRLVSESHGVLKGQADKMSACAALYIPVKSPYVDALPSDSPEDILEKRRLDVKRHGLVTDEREIIEALEHSDGDNYRFLPVKFKKDGGFDSRSTVAGKKGFDLLTEKTRSILEKIAREISGGNIETTPYANGKNTYCDWCPYRAACQFDVNNGRDRYRYIKREGHKETLKMLAEEEEKDNGC